MRIRKGRQVRGNILAMASPPHMNDISQQLELVSSSRGLKQKIHESGAMDLNVAEGSFEKAPLELLERLQISSTNVLIPPNRPYMNLDEFVTSLARTNCFPADDDSDDPYSDEDHSDDQHNNFIGQSCCNLTNSSVHARDDGESLDFGRMFGGAVSTGSAEELRGDIAAVETSLRLATPSSMSANPHYKPANPRTTASEMEAGAAAAANQSDQTMKSSTENVEQRSGRHTRVSSSPGSKSNRIPSPASFFPTDQTDTHEEASSDFSTQMAESSRKPPSKQRTPRTRVSVSSSTLKTPSNDASEERKQKLGKPIAKRMMKRSGRPKKLKYLQQENVEELGNQCNRRDGKGWTCPLLAKPGYQLCDHHLDKLRCKPGSRAKYNKSKKKKNKAES